MSDDRSAIDAETNTHQRLLVVEDGVDARNSLRDVLRLSLNLPVDVAEDGARGLEMLGERPYSLVITDLRMPKLSGMKLIEAVQARKMPVTVIVTTGHGSINEAVSAMRLGAYDFLTKPADPQHLCLLVQRALRERSLQDEIAALRNELAGRRSFRDIVSKSPRMIEVFDLIDQLAATTTTILICGETGTGKEMVARAIHQASAAHRTGPLVALNCAALSETLLESELFGHEKGAFTGAATQRKGRFEQANHGTLFLDEVGDVPASMQVKLLRVLQERTFERVGGAHTIEIDVRVIAASNRPLERLVKEGTFREDLFYRLNVIKIELPPLRERPEDIPALAAFFTEKYARAKEALPSIDAEAMELLLACDWPGNVRQLENAIERACVTVRDGKIGPKQLPPEVVSRTIAQPTMPVDLSRPISEQLAEFAATFEERYLRRALGQSRGHVGRCAEISGLSRRTITEKLALYNISKDEFKDL